MQTWDQLLDRYQRVCEVRGLSEAVVTGRRRELEHWGRWLRQQKPRLRVDAIGQDAVIDYVRARTAFHTRATVAGVMSQLRCFGEHLVAEGVWNQNPLRWIRSPKMDPRRHLPRGLDPDHLKKLIEAAAESHQSYSRHLWVTVLLVLYGTGIRRGELVALKVSDWDAETRTLRIDSTKSNRERRVPVPESVAAAIEGFIAIRQNHLICLGRDQTETTLLVRNKGGYLSGNAISVVLHRLAHKAGVPLVSVHQFRHACATDLMREGVGLAEVQKVLGHACIETTVRYAHVTDVARREAVARHPINGMVNDPSNTEEGNANE